MRDFGALTTPDILQSEIAATNCYELWVEGRIIGRRIGRHFRSIFVLYLLTHQSFLPQILPNLSLLVLSLKCRNFISTSFWRLGAPTLSRGVWTIVESRRSAQLPTGSAYDPDLDDCQRCPHGQFQNMSGMRYLTMLAPPSVSTPLPKIGSFPFGPV